MRRTNLEQQALRERGVRFYFSAVRRFEPAMAGWEVRTLPLCYAVPPSWLDCLPWLRKYPRLTDLMPEDNFRSKVKYQVGIPSTFSFFNFFRNDILKIPSSNSNIKCSIFIGCSFGLWKMSPSIKAHISGLYLMGRTALAAELFNFFLVTSLTC